MNEPAHIPYETQQAFAGPLLEWYAAHKRYLPWRRLQHDPYAIWVSEIMLQQTQVATVIPFYERWMARFPTVETLARAPLDDVLACWSGLGYYARARNLHRAAQIVVERFRGQIPSAEADLGSLQGIGRYTAGAIRSIAFDHPAPILDTNVTRVVSRVFAIDGDPKCSQNQRHLWSLAENLTPSERPGDFNQALMELGATVCSPLEPNCERCPLLTVCRAGNTSNPTAWPQIRPDRSTVRVNHVSLILSDGENVLLTQRLPHGLWGGLWEFPRRACASGESPAVAAVRAAREVLGIESHVGCKIGTVKHRVMHYAITLHGFEGRIQSGTPGAVDCAVVRWVPMEAVDSLALASPQRMMSQIVRDRLADLAGTVPRA